MMKKETPMLDVKWIVIHCTCTRPRQRVTVEDLDNWHQAKGWLCCGYHWVILQDGTIQAGRPESMAGAHVKHYNQHAIGVCYVGGMNEKGRYEDTRTPEQKAALWFLLKDLKSYYPKAKIVGHRDFPRVAKECPCFDVQAEFASLNDANLSRAN